MDITLAALASACGVLAGYLLLRGADSLLGLLLCLHGLFAQRWKKLANHNTIGLIKSRLILKLALRLACYALLCGFLLEVGDAYLQRGYRSVYAGPAGLLFAFSAAVVVLSRLMTSYQRMKLVWRLSHEFDFAARRERTQMLKS